MRAARLPTAAGIGVKYNVVCPACLTAHTGQQQGAARDGLHPGAQALATRYCSSVTASSSNP